jgi:tripartite-type tricarboxylate transporter receptor subunit TctC
MMEKVIFPGVYGEIMHSAKMAAGLFTALVMPLTAAPAAAQDYPGGKPIEMTVMFGAGSAADVTARHLADGMAKALKTPVPVVNRTGGGGAVGYTFVSQQKPDGHAIVWNSNSISTTHHAGTLPFDYTNFEPVARVSIELPVLAVRADSPWKTLKEFIEHAKANPGKLRIGNSGAGSHTHFTAAAMMATAGAKAIDVPFNGGEANVNLLGSRIEAIVQLPAAVIGHVKSGDFRVLACLGTKRDALFSDVPTAQEQGVNLGLDLWRGVAAPKGTPKAVIATLQGAIKTTVESPEFAEAGKTLGFVPAYQPAEEFGKLIAADDTKLAGVMAELGLKKK